MQEWKQNVQSIVNIVSIVGCGVKKGLVFTGGGKENGDETRPTYEYIEQGVITCSRYITPMSEDN